LFNITHSLTGALLCALDGDINVDNCDRFLHRSFDHPVIASINKQIGNFKFNRSAVTGKRLAQHAPKAYQCLEASVWPQSCCLYDVSNV